MGELFAAFIVAIGVGGLIIFRGWLDRKRARTLPRDEIKVKG